MARKNSSVVRVKLKNGLTALLERNGSSPVAAINVWVKVGSGGESDDEKGLAHLHEHMLFKGTGSLGPGELAFEVESAGGRINAYTSFDQTVYQITAASGSLDRSIDLLADSVLNSVFDAGELEKETEVVLEEIRRDKDSPASLLSRRLFASAYENHPYGHSILGTEKSVRSFTRDKVLGFYRKWYSPENMVVSIVGDFEPEAVLGRVRKRFGSLKNGRALPSVPAGRSAGRKTPAVSVLRKDIREGYFALAFRIPGIGDEDVPALDIISEAMGAGESSRLFRVVKEEKGVVNTVYSYAYTPLMGGVFIIGGTVKPDSAASAYEEILRMVFGLAEGGLNPSEIEKAKLNIESDRVRSRETVQGRAGSLGFYEAIAGDCMFEKLYMEKVRSVRADDIRRVARKYFTPSNLSAVALLPKDSAVSDNLVKKAVLRAKPEGRGAGKSRKTGIRTLENGIRVIIKEDKSVPLFAARLLVPAGLRFEDKRMNGISNFTANMLTRGTSRRSAKQIAEEMESLAGHIEGFSGRDSAGVSMEALSSNFDSAMDIFSDVALNPSFPEDEARRAKREILAAINRKNDNLSSVCIDRFIASLFKGSPYSLDVTGTAASVKKFSGKDSGRFHEKTFNPEKMVLVVVGDVDTDRVLGRLGNGFARLPKVRDKIRPCGISMKMSDKPVKTVKKIDDKQQTHIAVGFIAPQTGSADYYPFQVLNAVLSGQGGRLFMKLRDEMSLAYSVDSFYGAGVESGYFGAYIATSPHKEKSALGEILTQFSAVLKDGVTENEAERARNRLAADFEIGLQRNSARASIMGFGELYGVGWDEHRNFSRKILAVTPRDVLRVAKRYIKLDSRVVSVVKGSGG